MYNTNQCKVAAIISRGQFVQCCNRWTTLAIGVKCKLWTIYYFNLFHDSPFVLCENVNVALFSFVPFALSSIVPNCMHATAIHSTVASLLLPMYISLSFFPYIQQYSHSLHEIERTNERYEWYCNGMNRVFQLNFTSIMPLEINGYLMSVQCGSTTRRQELATILSNCTSH